MHAEARHVSAHLERKTIGGFFFHVFTVSNLGTPWRQRVKCASPHGFLLASLSNGLPTPKKTSLDDPVPAMAQRFPRGVLSFPIEQLISA